MNTLMTSPVAPLLAQLLADDAGNKGATADPLAPKPSHFPAKAKRVIFIFSNGGATAIIKSLERRW